MTGPGDEIPAQPQSTGPVSPLEYVPENYLSPIDLGQVFPKAGRLEIDLGCGDGSFLVAMAARRPEWNYLGTERLAGRVRSTGRKASRAGLTNVRLLRMESNYAIRYLLPAGSVGRCYILFPDPWPKRRHWPRRLIQPEFLLAAAAALQTGGDLCIKTDDSDYFAYIRKLTAACEAFAVEAWNEDVPLTDFERHYVAEGRSIHSMRLVKR